MSEYNLIASCPKSPKDNNKRRKKVHFNERGNRALQEESGNGDDDNDQNIYTSMACMSGNDKSSSGYFGDISQLTNWILDSGATCHMSPKVSDFIPDLLEDTDKYIEFMDEHYAMAKQKV